MHNCHTLSNLFTYTLQMSSLVAQREDRFRVYFIHRGAGARSSRDHRSQVGCSPKESQQCLRAHSKKTTALRFFVFSRLISRTHFLALNSPQERTPPFSHLTIEHTPTHIHTLTHTPPQPHYPPLPSVIIMALGSLQMKNLLFYLGQKDKRQTQF